MRLIRYAALYILPVLLGPSLLRANEGVDVSFSVQSVAIQDKIAAILGAQTAWSLAAEDVSTGKSLISSRKTEASFSPGSLMKLIITGALLDQNSRSAVDLSTIIAVDGNVLKGKLNGDVIIRGAGNCLLTSRDLAMGVERIKSLGIKEIAGDVIVDDSFFNAKGWSSRYNGPAYGVPAALGMDLHTVSIAFEGNRIAVDPPNDAVKVSLNPSGRLAIRQIDDLTYEVTGALEKTTAFRSRFSIADPALYAGGVFLTLIKKQGVAVSGTIKRGIMPAEAREVARIGSSDLKAVIREVNRQSLNVAADNMLFMLGALTSGLPGTREKGIQAVNGFLRELGVPLKGLVIDDGSGVSKRNRVSAEQLVAFLRLAVGRPWFTDFHESLSRPGMDGRLQDFGYRSERIRMKSGQLTDAYGLAGYIDRLDGKRIAFAYLVNGSGLDAPTATSAGVEVLRQLEQ